ncbi:MAG: tetratricopeptide repeat protein [Candidatus Lokiarchaeota archaeon]|nr:tetratricopeptide repeat protein [Candidatus Lokiarchaeota archaeon]
MSEQEENIINSLISIGRFNEAYSRITDIEKTRSLTNNEKLLKYYSQIFIYNDKGEFQKGSDLADQMIIESTDQNNKLGLIDAFIGKIECALHLDELDNCDKLINKINLLIEKYNDVHDKEIKKREGYLRFLKARIFQERSIISKAIDLFKESIKIWEEIGNDYGIIFALLNWGFLTNYFGNTTEAKNCHERSLKISEKLYVEVGIIWNTISLGWINYHSRNLDLAIQNANKVLSISELKGFKFVSPHAYDLLAHCYNLEGNLQKALYYSQKSLIMKQEEKYNSLLPHSYYSIGNIYSQKGELRESLEYFNKGLKLQEAENNISPVYLIAMGKIYGELGEYLKAKELLLKGLNLLKKKKNTLFYHFLPYHNSLAQAYHYLIVLSINNKDRKNVEEYLEEILQLNNSTIKVKHINHIYRLDKAIFLISNNRLMDTMSAGKILKELIDEKDLDHEIAIEAMLNLCEVLLHELKIAGNDDILDELTELSDKLLNIAQRQYLHVLLSETYLMKARISLINLDTNQTRSYLTKAQKIANQHGLQLLANKISQEHDSLLKNLDDWENKKKLKIPLKERLTDSRYEFLFSKMIRTKMEEVPIEIENPFYFVILNKIDGQCIYERIFKEEQVKESNIITNLINSINIYGKEAFSSTGSIDRIKHGDNTIIFRSIDNLIYVYVFRGSSYSAVNNMDTIIKSMTSSNNVLDALNHSIYNHNKISDIIKLEMDNKMDDIFF